MEDVWVYVIGDGKLANNYIGRKMATMYANHKTMT